MTLGFLFAYGAVKESEDPAELLWQLPHASLVTMGFAAHARGGNKMLW